MKKLMIVLAAGAAILMTGCSVTKVEYEKNDKGVVSYRIYRNSHWLKMDAEGMTGGMSGDGKFEIGLEGMKASPSEEFNRTMQTYTTAFIQLAQIAAAAYNPSASAAIQSAAAKQEAAGGAKDADALAAVAKKVAAVQSAAAGANASTCEGGACTDKATCAGGACTDTAACAGGACTDTAACAGGACTDTK